MNPTEPSTGETDHPALIRPVFAERYRELGEGVVCDLQTGLYWLVKPLGCEGEPARHPWAGSLAGR